MGVTKEKYFEICEALGTEPILEDTPVEPEDFLIELQEAFSIYSKLRDEWDYMSGEYQGKSYSGLGDILEILEVPKEDRKTVFELISTIDKHRAKAISNHRKSNKPEKAAD